MKYILISDDDLCRMKLCNTCQLSTYRRVEKKNYFSLHQHFSFQTHTGYPKSDFKGKQEGVKKKVNKNRLEIVPRFFYR